MFVRVAPNLVVNSDMVVSCGIYNDVRCILWIRYIDGAYNELTFDDAKGASKALEELLETFNGKNR